MLASPAVTREGRIGIVQAVAATGFFSTSAILVRWAQDLSPVEVTSLRLLLGGLLVAAAAWGSGERVGLAGDEFRRLTRRMLMGDLLALGAAVAFALYSLWPGSCSMKHRAGTPWRAPPSR